jgi:hypothetical protein
MKLAVSAWCASGRKRRARRIGNVGERKRAPGVTGQAGMEASLVPEGEISVTELPGEESSEERKQGG